MTIKDLLTFLQLFATFGNICIMLYALKTFLNKPHDTLAERVSNLEFKQKEIEDSLHRGNDKFKEHDDRFEKLDDTNEVLINSTFALLEFEVHYCETEQKPISKNLEKAKDNLHAYLAKK